MQQTNVSFLIQQRTRNWSDHGRTATNMDSSSSSHIYF